VGRTVELLDRDGDIEAIESTIESAVAGSGAALVLAGSAGLGKTSLLGVAEARAADREVVVLRAHGDELEQGFPWGGAIQMFEGVLRDPEAGALLAGAAGLVRPLLEHARATAKTTSQDAFPLLHGLYWLTANLCDRGPLLFVVDDAQWLDPETLHFLNYLLARIGELAAAMLVAERPGEPVDSGAAELLARLRARPQVRTRALTPLAEPAARRLARSELPGAGDALCAAVAAAGAGNPFFTRELAAAARSEGLEADARAATRLRELRPEQIRASILVRLGRLGDAAARLATAVAVLGPSATRQRAAALAELDDEGGAAALDALVAAGILDGAAPLRFGHPIVRDLVYADIPLAGRRRAHLAAAGLLHEARASAEEIASQLRAGDRAGEDWAVAALREAAGAALVHRSPGTAVRLLRRALDEAPPPVVRRDLLVELGTAEAAAAEPGAVDHMVEAMQLAGDGPEGVRIAALLGEALFVAGRYLEAMEAFERGLDLFEQRGRVDGSDAEAALLAGASAAGRFGLRPSERLRARSEALMDDAPAAAPSVADRVLIAVVAGAESFDVRVAHERLAALAARALDGEALPDALGRVVVDHVTMALAACDRLERAIAAVDSVIETARGRGEVAGYVDLLSIRGWFALRAGKLPLALVDADEAISLSAAEPGDHPSLALAHLVLAEGSLDRGDLDQARRAVDIADADERWGGTLYFHCLTYGAGRVELACGAPAAALETLRAAGAAHVAMGVRNPAFSPWRGYAAQAASRLGDDSAAHTLADEEVELARRFGAAGATGIALRARALVESSAPDRLDLLREAADTLADSPLALEHARCLVELGSALRRAGWSRAARGPLQDGLERSREGEAHALAERAAEELVASGARPRTRARSGVEALTPSERRVAVMAGGGMSNREIAEALFVTRRTVETHLTHAYEKLEISSRDDLANALGRIA
jgi:DNA-binding CsgD family transcriptional regulator/tetratricopeptide (TPR) repeat protein